MRSKPARLAILPGIQTTALHDGRMVPGVFMAEAAGTAAEGGSVVNVRLAMPEVLFERLTETGRTAHVVPSIFGTVQARFTVLLDVLRGAIVSTELPLCPAVTETEVGLGETLKSGVMTVKPLLWAEALS
jgi:hypothetical protein